MKVHRQSVAPSMNSRRTFTTIFFGWNRVECDVIHRGIMVVISRNFQVRNFVKLQVHWLFIDGAVNISQCTLHNLQLQKFSNCSQMALLTPPYMNKWWTFVVANCEESLHRLMSIWEYSEARRFLIIRHRVLRLHVFEMNEGERSVNSSLKKS